MLGNSVRSTKGLVVLLASVVFIAAFVGLVFNHVDSWDAPLRYPPTTEKPQGNRGGMSDAVLRKYYLDEMYKPSVAPDAPAYNLHGAVPWELDQGVEPYWREPLGEKLCIIDLDNRPFDEEGQIFGPQVMDWNNATFVHGLSAGVLNHYIYARIHGYKYYFIATEDPLDRRASWKKPPVISKILKEHDVCIYLDSDAIFHNLDLPFEWLLNYWQLNPKNNSMALALDPVTDWNYDRHGKINLNTGFIISQNQPTTYKIMKDWERCPDDDTPYPGCQDFRKNTPGQPTDQGGFGSFVRYNWTEDIRDLLCTEANGFPESDSGCKGSFIRHLWTGKDDQIKVDVGQQVPGPYLANFHRQYLKEKPSFYIEEKDLFAKGPKQAIRDNQRAASRAS